MKGHKGRDEVIFFISEEAGGPGVENSRLYIPLYICISGGGISLRKMPAGGAAMGNGIVVDTRVAVRKHKNLKK
ncbi:hypothetical protein [Anaplasma marginale]|uniref:hypothetical protein n=1 Tax=Anaplasma marginale TaxID=770 RepID=UPI001CC25754|nr:hypothetical protein [Anaplasma marginale]